MYELLGEGIDRQIIEMIGRWVKLGQMNELMDGWVGRWINRQMNNNNVIFGRWRQNQNDENSFDYERNCMLQCLMFIRKLYSCNFVFNFEREKQFFM